MSMAAAQLQWPSLAQDLAVMTVPGTPLTDLSQILETYGISEADLKEILTVPSFQTMLQRELERCNAQGSRAGEIYRFSTLSQSLSEHLFRQAMNSDMEAKDAIRLLELLLKASGTVEPAKAQGSQVNTQVNVGVTLPLPHNLSNPKLDHLAELKDGEKKDV